MASMMVRVTVKDLKEMLANMDDDKHLGHLFSCKGDWPLPEHQVLVFFEPIKPL